MANQEIHPDQCDIFGCRNPKAEPEALVEMTILNVDVTKTVCDFHRDFFEAASTELYEVGFTFRGDVELRLIPATPTP